MTPCLIGGQGSHVRIDLLERRGENVVDGLIGPIAKDSLLPQSCAEAVSGGEDKAVVEECSGASERRLVLRDDLKSVKQYFSS